MAGRLKAWIRVAVGDGMGVWVRVAVGVGVNVGSCVGPGVYVGGKTGLSGTGLEGEETAAMAGWMNGYPINPVYTIPTKLRVIKAKRAKINNRRAELIIFDNTML